MYNVDCVFAGTCTDDMV